MNSVNDPDETAKNPADPAITDEQRTIALFESISERLRSLDVRFEVIEKRLGYLDRDVLRAMGADVHAEGAEPLTEPHSDPLSPPYALRCDGRVLLSTHDLEGIDLSERETFTGIVLSEAEASDALDRMADLFEDAAAHTAGWVRRKVKKGGGSHE